MAGFLGGGRGPPAAAILQRLPDAYRTKFLGFAREAREHRENEVVSEALWDFLDHFAHERKTTVKTAVPAATGVPAGEKTEEVMERVLYTDPSGRLGSGFTPREAAFIKLLDDHASYQSFMAWVNFVRKDGKVQGVLRVGGKVADAVANSADRAETSYKEYRRQHPRKK